MRKQKQEAAELAELRRKMVPKARPANVLKAVRSATLHVHRAAIATQFLFSPKSSAPLSLVHRPYPTTDNTHSTPCQAPFALQKQEPRFTKAESPHLVTRSRGAIRIACS